MSLPPWTREREREMDNGRKLRYSKWVITAAVVILTLAAKLEAAADESRVSLSLGDCPEKCGEIKIPYPFGIGKDCFYEPFFSITCNTTLHPSPTPIYGRNFEVIGIDLLNGQIRTSNYIARSCYYPNGTQGRNNPAQSRLTKFSINSTQNILVATGCDTYAWFTGSRSNNRKYRTGCMTQCSSLVEVENGTCSGVGCCETLIPEGANGVSIEARSFSNYTGHPEGVARCSVAFVVDKDCFNFTRANLTNSYDQIPETLPVAYDWTIGDQSCAEAHANGTCLCCESQASKCVDNPKLKGYRCSCLPGYYGNPYLPQGCQDINECSYIAKNDCESPASCFNTPGSYYCQCPKGFRGTGTNDRPCARIRNTTPIEIVLSVGGSVIFLLVLGILLHCYHGKRQMEKMRSTYFRKNGGLILHQRLSNRDASVDFVKIFTVEDLKKATNNYSDNNIIGRGGFGLVFKGTLPNNQVVAIKRSLKVDSSQMEQFINEVLVLSQVNNRNIVKLLGCCLETEVPLLVYEFIRNGTLYEHLHDDQMKASLLSWDIRLRIATEVAEVLAYLHTTISTPIIHRDIKSMNILLDENYVAKVSDFGASRLVPMDQNQVATMVLGTHGYLDPEYMQTSELNEKSDVYSFGVVLLELLTGRKALCFNRPENERCLAMYFLLKFRGQSMLEIIDEKIMGQGATEQLIEQLTRTAILARRCLQLRGEDRPNMREVATELGQIRRKGVQPWSTKIDLFDEEKQNLLNKTLEDAGVCNGESTSETNNSHARLSSCSLQLVPR